MDFLTTNPNLSIFSTTPIPTSCLSLKPTLPTKRSSKSHFANKTVFKIPNYLGYHCNHPDGSAHGGAAVIIRAALRHYKAPPYRTDKIQANVLNIHTQPWSFNVAALYSPRLHSIRNDDYNNFLHHLDTKFIAGGNWNDKHTNWGSRLTTLKGRNLLQSITNFNCTYLSTAEPTYWPTDPNKVPDLLDFLVIKGFSKNYLQLTPNWDLPSDHTPIIATLSTHVFRKPPAPRLSSHTTNRNFFRTHSQQATPRHATSNPG